MFRTLAAAALALAVSLPAQATFERRDSSFGANTLVYEVETGIQWLRPDAADGFSLDHYTAQLQDGGSLADYRWATTQEVAALFNRSGVHQFNDPRATLPASFVAAQSFHDYFGDTYAWTQPLEFFLAHTAFIGTTATRVGYFDDTIDLDTNAAWLILDQVSVPVPEPTTAVLMLLGLAGLAVAARRRSGCTG